MTTPPPEAARWLPIETYPRHADSSTGCLWGPTTLLRFQPKADWWPYSVLTFIGWLEADMWLFREPGDPVCCGEFEQAPDAWMPLPDSHDEWQRWLDKFPHAPVIVDWPRPAVAP